MKDLALLGIFAHPDDEQTLSGTFAQAAREGIRTGLICATRGEAGEISDPALATPDNLGQVRESELRAAVTVLGVKYLWFLGYRDSGMMGTPENDNPESFYRVNQEEAVGRIVGIIRDFKPTVIVTFEPAGGYGHPDHITISKLATIAFDAAADPNAYPKQGSAWQTARLFYTAFPRSTMSTLNKYLAESGEVSDLGDLDPEQFGLADEDITNQVDVSEWKDLKVRSLNMHRTQMNPDSPFSKLPPEIEDTLRRTEHFVLVKGVSLPGTPEARGDLFTGLR